MLPKIFIGSSKEGLAYAEAVKFGLKGYAQCCLWTESFKLSETVIDSLINRLQEIDFAIFVLTPDDLLESRGESHKTTRDNILLEIGLSIGYLGRERVYLVKPDSPLIKMPTDLSGVIIGEYEAEHDSVFSAVGNFCTLVKSNLEKYGYRLSKKAEKYGLFEEIHHVNLPVRNLNASIEFYTQKLQMREIERLPYPFPGAWLGLPSNQQLHLIEIQDDDKYIATNGERHETDFNPKNCHFAIRVNLMDWRKILDHLSNENVPIKPSKYLDVNQIYILDPDKHIIEINGFTSEELQIRFK